MRRICVYIALLCASIAGFSQTGVVQGHCYLGGKQAITSGLNSTNYNNGIIPACTVTAYLTGTTTTATITKPDGSALSNPFTANALGAVDVGGWIFRAATNQGLDVVMQGGGGNPGCTTQPNCYAQPVTLTDVFPSQSFNPVAGVTSAQGTFPIQVNGVSSTPETGNITVSCANNNCGQGFQMDVVPPVAGQYVIVRASVNSATGNGGQCATTAMLTTDSTAYMFTGPTGGLCSTGMTGSWSGFAANLPSYVNPANITSIIPFGIGAGTGTMLCLYNGVSANSVGGFIYKQYTGSGAGWGTDLSKVTCTFSYGSSSSGGKSYSYTQDDIGLFVFYTGTAPPANTATLVEPPLKFNSSTSTLSLSNPLDLGTDTGAANAYVVSIGDTTVCPTTGTTVSFVPAHANTSTTPTLNVNNCGAGTIVSPTGTALAAGDVTTTALAAVRFGVTGNWRLQNPQVSGSGGGTTTNALTMNNSGSGAASGTTFDGSAAQTISYNTIGAQQALTLTTTGTSGPATLSGGALNIPQYSAGGSGVSSLNSLTGALSLTSSDSSVTITPSGSTINLQTSASVSGVQYNPTTTNYYVLGSSLWADDGLGTSSPVPVSTWSCSGTTCTFNTSSSHNLTTSDWVDVANVTGWFAPPSFRGTTDTGIGTFKVASVPTSTQFTISYTLNTGSGSGGNAYSADYWGVYQLAQQPFFSGHGTTFYRFSFIANAAAHFSSVVNCSSGTPTYLIIMGGENDIANGDSEATIEANFQSVWSQAHAAGCIVIQGGILSTNFGVVPNGQAATWQKLADLNQWLRLQNKTFFNTSSGQYWDNYVNVDAIGFDERVESYNSFLPQRFNSALSSQSSNAVGPPPVFAAYGIGPAIAFAPVGKWTFLGANGFDAATVFDPSGYSWTMTQNCNTLGCPNFPIIKETWPGIGTGKDGCNTMSVGGGGTNELFAYCAHYTTTGNSNTNYFSIGLNSNTNGVGNPFIKFLASGATQIPGLASGGGTKLVSTDASGNLGVTTAGAGTVTSSGTPAAGGIAAFTSATDITTATATQVNTLIKTLTGCSTPTFVYTPQAGDCVSPGTPTVPVGVNWTLNTGVAATPAAVIETAPNSGSVTACAFTTTTSDGTTDLTFNILFNGVSVLSGGTCTVTHGATAGAITACTLTGTITITAGQNWQLNTTAGTSSWTGSVSCH